MAQLPGGNHLMQQINGRVVLFDRWTERELVSFNPADANAVAQAQKAIYDANLDAEDKCFAHFWSGYFYAHSGTEEL